MIRDVYEEDEIVKQWQGNKPDRTMPIHCVYRERYGESSCLCVRELFPSEEFYLLYLELREWYVSRTAEKIAEAIIGDIND